MTLERYVLLENGKVIELTRNPEGILCNKENGNFISLFEKSIVATSPDIWGLEGYGWMAHFEDEGWEWFGFIVDLQDIHSLVSPSVCYTTFDGNEASTSREFITALFAPITENGKVVRYERVYEREETEK